MLAALAHLTSGWHVIRVSAVHHPDGATHSATTTYRYAVLDRNGVHPGACCTLDTTAPTITVTSPGGADVSPAPR